MRFLHRIKQIVVISGDILSFALGLILALSVRNLDIPTQGQILELVPLFVITFIFWVVVNFINGLYDFHLRLRDKAYYRTFIEAAGISLVVSVIFFYLLPQKDIAPKTILLLNVIFGYSFSFVWRFIANGIIGSKQLRNNLVFVGRNNEVDELEAIINKYPEKGYKIIKVLDYSREGISGLEGLLSENNLDTVVITNEVKTNKDWSEKIYNLLFSDVRVMDLAAFYEMVTGRITPYVFSDTWFINNLKKQEQPIYERLRVMFDYIAGIVIFIIFLVLFIPIAAAIKINSRGPIIIKQKRVGKNGQEFTMYKFRSMKALAPDGSAEIGKWEFAQKNDDRVTRVGKLLRKTRLDELPQGLNLLKKDVTLIGPRPERPEIVSELEKDMPYYNLRHIVKPGLMSWAMIHQDYTDTIESSLKKLEYDLYYIKNRSALIDLSILLRTINKVLRLMGQ